jgi:hypothetical protein
VAGVALRLADGVAPAAALRDVVVRRPRRHSAAAGPLPVPIDDSKRITLRYGRAGLVRGVALLSRLLGSAPPRHLADLIARHAVLPPETHGRTPWGTDLHEAVLPEVPLPDALPERLAARGAWAVALRLVPVQPAELNRGIEATGNKARVLGQAAGGLLLDLLARADDEDVEVVFDRQGGRLDYGAYLADLFPFASIDPRPAARGDALYAIRWGGRRLRVGFATRGDGRDLLVAWASMAAKLVRELFMDRLNAYFLGRLPGTRPTKGYVEDGRRFLADVQAVLQQEGIGANVLVRSR